MRRIGVEEIAIPDDIQEALGLAWVGKPDELGRLLAEADFVVVAVPLNEHTRGLLGSAELGALRSSAFLINPARAEIIDEQALYEALRDHAFAGAALDPRWHYPRQTNASPPPDSRSPSWTT